MELTRQMALQKTAEMWERLANHPFSPGYKYFTDNNVVDHPSSYGYLYEYDNINSPIFTTCSVCPLKGGG
jgi:hypothetical protein